MLCLLILARAAAEQTLGIAMPLDATAIKAGAPVPGLMFSRGPRGTGVIAYTDADGGLMLLDQERRRQTIGGVRDAVLPAWSTDGERLAYAQKSGRRKYRLMCVSSAK
jgi:hypothetical protein